MLLKLGEAGVVELLVSYRVLEELENVIRRKAAWYITALVLLLDRSQIISVPDASSAVIEQSRKMVSHIGDAHILADAWHNHADFFVTLDRTHFINIPALVDETPFPIGTPGDCLKWLKDKISL